MSAGMTPRLLALTAVAVVFFAANSLLTRAALAEGLIGAGSFAAIRTGSGAAMLLLLIALQKQRPVLWQRGRLIASLGLFAYMAGFSYAYISLDAGIGALILFATVQATMFAGGVISGEAVPPRRWIGMGLAMAGLVALFLPRVGAAPDPLGAALMFAAAVGFGLYSLVGIGSRAPLADTAVTFALAALPALLLPLLWPGETPATVPGMALAAVSGAITSGLGYAMWYTLIPALGAVRAAVSQLTTPVVALVGGAVLLGEAVPLGAVLACALVVLGVTIGLRR
jgi:drug/metabolite transporter (DMT)-like permease